MKDIVMNEFTIIGLCGEKGSGKDIVANHLVEKYDFVKISFAYSVKKIISELFGWSYEMLLGETEESRQWRETKDEWWTNKLNMDRDITPRFIMQHIGTDVMRNHFHPDIWVLTVEKQMKDIMDKTGKTKFIVSDLRFINEYEWIKSFACNKIMHVQRGDLPSYYNDVKHNGITEIEGVHISEILWMTFEIDISINNNKEIKEMLETVDKHIDV